MNSLIFTVPQSHCVVLERFGKFSRIQTQGLGFRIPILEQSRRVDTWGDIANKNGFIIELTEQQSDTKPRQCHTRDNVPVTVNASIYWRITDVKKALYEVDILPQAIADIALNALRSNIGTMEFDHVLAERAQLNEKIAGQLSQTAQKWGIIFTRVEIQELTTDSSVAASMVKQMDAERSKRARIAEAQGQAEAEIKLAEAQKQAAILRAEGEAVAKKTIADAETYYLEKLKSQVGVDAATQIVLAQKYLSGFEVISKNDADKVFLPNTFQGLFSLPTDR